MDEKPRHCRKESAQRTNIVIASQAREDFPGCKVARSVEEALSLCSGQEKVFIIGGATIAPPAPGLQTLHHPDSSHLRRCRHLLSEINETEWELTGEEHHFRTSGTLTALRSRPTPEKQVVRKIEHEKNRRLYPLHGSRQVKIS